MTSTNDIRAAFLNYFREKDHEIVASGPLVPHNDPTLLFTNAGMVPFKNVFTGIETRDIPRAASSQKCVRAGGKHNDLENVGFTARHHTFFEMLGNFSFGDYFKERAIEQAWHLLVKEFGLDPAKLLVTVYHDDDQAFDLWKKIAGLSEDRIIRIPTSDNFWSMGETGPCGPCSEIFYDHGAEIEGGPPGSATEDGDRFIEIWNLVFMQYEQVDKDTRRDLPRPSIDTGMGLERLAAVLQGKHDNYDIDLFRHLIEASADVTKTATEGPHGVSHRVIADHLRSVSFLIADGVMPSNEGRGYVLRRILRRAVRHAHIMGCTDAVLHQLVPALITEMGQAFPELKRAEALITETLKMEESRFRTTLERGLGLLAEETQKLPDGAVLPGDVAFKLYDTFGFPLDLTQDALRAEGRGVDTDGFDEAMNRQRADARAAWSGSGEAATEEVWFELRDTLGATEFLGYDTEFAEGAITAILVDGDLKDDVTEGETAAIITNQTPFYGESGGQSGDCGILFSKDGTEFTVESTQKRLGDMIVHMGTVTRGKLAKGDVVELRVDGNKRNGLRANHSATHILHAALRAHLGDHVTQKGSMVAADRLRFDVSHPKPMKPDELAQVVFDVNAQIRANMDVHTRIMTPKEAVDAGAMALFGEKYGDEVRVVAMGEYSTELCGGTHVSRTGDIGGFRIISETGLAAGIRRIEAVAGAAADAYDAANMNLLMQTADVFKSPLQDIPARAKQLLDDRRALEREVTDLRKKLALSGGASGAGGDAGDEPDDAREVAGVRLVTRVLDGVPAKDLKSMVDAFKKQGSGVYAVISAMDGKASIVVGVTEDLVDRFNAVDLVRAGSEALGGKGGGGRPDMAQAGGSDASGADGAFDAIAALMDQ
ncbi:MAG: alanine--tRNA ligase [Rhodospirillales bacterium]|nr:alanine--tRNA ligase [Rhodospirillales bacterium]MBT4007562.1 alanine--tRNA ligase [Rhodospirillales bacterium]MBT5077225.1 alanine--tRNA ligase [Rhodospirillales bacterium]MBT5671909.1 alanine--tRNA ligase [Rhodospirillales bacterium]MBT6186766.1 alanine--tRNA ligase [Rhodospirillales bacterium]